MEGRCQDNGCEQGPWAPRQAEPYRKDGKVWGRTRVNIGKKNQGRPPWPEAKLNAGCPADRLCLYSEVAPLLCRHMLICLPAKLNLLLWKPGLLPSGSTWPIALRRAIPVPRDIAPKHNSRVDT